MHYALFAEVKAASVVHPSKNEYYFHANQSCWLEASVKNFLKSKYNRFSSILDTIIIINRPTLH